MFWAKWLIMGIGSLILWIWKKLSLEVINTFTQMFSALVTAAALALLVYQTFLQEETSNRSWAADRLAVIYAKDPKPEKYVRQEAVRAYVLLHRDLGMRRFLFWLRRDSRAVLSGADLSSMDFTGQDFSRAILFDAAMENTIFSRSNLFDADLRTAKARSANFEGVNLSESSLNGANLEGANFRKAQLTGAEFCEIDLGTFRCLGSTNAMNADFDEAIFDAKTRFCNVNISGAKLAGAIGLTQEHIDCRNTFDDKTTLPPGLRRP